MYMTNVNIIQLLTLPIYIYTYMSLYPYIDMLLLLYYIMNYHLLLLNIFTLEK